MICEKRYLDIFNLNNLKAYWRELKPTMPIITGQISCQKNVKQNVFKYIKVDIFAWKLRLFDNFSTNDWKSTI